MKKLCFILSFVIPWLSTLKSQCNHSLDSIIYEKAYNYVVTDSLFFGKHINVSQKLIGTFYILFSKEIAGDNYSESRFLEFSDLDRKYAVSNDSLSLHVSEQFEKFPFSMIFLSFSKITNKFDIFADVRILNIKDPSGEFGEFVLFYFNFDSQGNIKHVCKKRLHGL